ncbi:hypothetical protein OsJ_30133 [Oryza sativa Japonica Group]|uniref:OTU domain-containing protein n=1 Tax=Oryza sativa subsp. japonica TaxID=39947 RepID=B9G4S0_ORYSJ|nr:hypothetical protein OsJ_30133 [Oryza sativa Japonica Group]
MKENAIMDELPNKSQVNKCAPKQKVDILPVKENAIRLQSSEEREVNTKFSVTGICGDGRCLFRSIVHGAYIKLMMIPPDDNLEKDMADDLRKKVCDALEKECADKPWMPITVFVVEKTGGLRVFTKYGKEYGRNAIQVLFDGNGHYDVLSLR